MDPGPNVTKKGNTVGNMPQVVTETLDNLSGGGWGAID